jgi:hypothetical protein
MTDEGELHIGETLRNTYTGNIVEVESIAGNLYCAKVIEPGPGQVPAALEYKIGRSWWNFYERCPRP